ncbi:diguanylate cyclase [Gluconacetobacter azotocaptans]|uniref:two-component regulator propeller domain-containing protein n=1 Tax=Gluconacetobacter azotocaptans TaxID=142834 RepID=UPI00195C9D0E|nr:diguanylate cyclase [Gluconacetobacter azotocaptans]
MLLRLAVVTLCGLVGFMPRAEARAPAPPLANYVIDHWSTRDGLPQNSIRDIAQTPDGRLWFATWEGLVSYDGMEFTVYDRGSRPALLDNGIGTIVADQAGTLWFSDSRGNIGRHAADGSWRLWPHPANAPSIIVQSLQIDPTGRLWLLYEGNGLGTMTADGTFHYVAPPPKSPLLNLYRRMVLDSTGTLWLGTYDGVVVQGAQGQVHTAPAAWNLPHGLAWPYRGPDGTFWIVAGSRIFRVGEAGASLQYDLHGIGRITALLQDRHGALWAGTEDHGLIRLTGSGIERLPDYMAPASGRILCLREDTEGSIWIGSNGGLYRLREALFGTVSRRDGLPDDFARVVLEDRGGRLWVGTDAGLARVEPDGTVVAVPLSAEHDRQPAVLSLAEDAGGTLWVGTYSDGVYERLPDGSSRHFGTANGLPAGNVRALSVGADGQVWIGTQHGVFHVEGGLPHPLDGPDAPHGLITALAARGDDLWIGTLDGVRHVHGSHIQAIRFGGAQGAHTIFGFTTIGGDLWIASDRGVYRARDGQISQVAREQGLPVDSIFATIPDRQGHVWLTSNRGVLRLPLSELEAVANGRSPRVSVLHFDETDGLLSSQANGSASPSAIMRRDGTIWIATAIGIAHVDPAQFDAFVMRPPPPPVAISSIERDGSEVHQPLDGSALHLRAGHGLSVRYVALSYLFPDRIVYRTKLEGLSDSWSLQGNTRNIHLVGLPPGQYTLRVSAAHPGGAWSTHDMALPLVVDPLWWQRREVWVGAAAAAGLMLVAIYLGIAHYYRRQSRRLSRIIGERTRELRQTAERLQAADHEKTLLLERLRQQADVATRQAREDSLTSLLNRRAFDERLALAMDGIAAGGPGFCLALIDVDHFKSINDRHSHAAGDLVLREVGVVLRACVRASDVVARIGGEEFAILMPTTSLPEAQEACRRLRVAFHAKQDWGGALALPVTFSAGLVIPRPGETSAAVLLQRADAALYQAKNTGRDRVCSSD